MARDPQPEGLITFHEAFGVLCDTYPMVAQDKLRRRMHQACKDGALKGFVLLPGIPTRFVVSPAMWSDGAFPDRVFLTEDISEQATGAWAAYAGRTAFVDNGEFRRWLDNSTPATALKRAGYLTVDQALNWILWGDHTGDTMQLLIASTMGGEADRPRVSFPAAAAMLLEMLVSGDAPAVTSVVGTGEVRPVERAAFVGGEVQHNGEAGGHVIRVLQTSGQERFHAMTRGYHNLLRIEAAPFAAAVERRFAYPPEPIPTCIQLDREQEFTPWAEAALWIGNGCKDGKTPDDAFEVGSEAIVRRLVARELVARGRYFAPDPTEDGHGYQREVDAKLWDGAILVDDVSEKPNRPRVVFHRESDSFAVALYLPDRLAPSWDALEIVTAGLFRLIEPHESSEPQISPSKAKPRRKRPDSAPKRALLAWAKWAKRQGIDIDGLSAGNIADQVDRWLANNLEGKAVAAQDRLGIMQAKTVNRHREAMTVAAREVS